MSDILAYIVTAVLGGGFFKGAEALYRAIAESKEKKSLTAAVGAKTPAEIESISVATMASALESAQTRIQSLEQERETDRTYYQNRILELNEQLSRVRAEMASMETKLASLLAETHPDPDRFEKPTAN